jgi:hypothetical protein
MAHRRREETGTLQTELATTVSAFIRPVHSIGISGMIRLLNLVLTDLYRRTSGFTPVCGNLLACCWVKLVAAVHSPGIAVVRLGCR